jgi:hypothetical protein|tara:strand:- start:14789 stop:15235 length:447 start_codon:yes stop_codon:yes gene_type:complete
MLTLEQVFEMWKKDCQIDENNLDAATIENAKLHSKYLELHSMSKLQLKRKELEFKVLLKDKWLWYNGKMTQDEIEAKGWDYDPLNGLKILKGEMDYYYDSDKEIQEAQAKIEYLKEMCETLKEIIDTIKWRHQSIKNMIEWRKFTSGV